MHILWSQPSTNYLSVKFLFVDLMIYWWNEVWKNYYEDYDDGDNDDDDDNFDGDDHCDDVKCDQDEWHEAKKK